MEDINFKKNFFSWQLILLPLQDQIKKIDALLYCISWNTFFPQNFNIWLKDADTG